MRLNQYALFYVISCVLWCVGCKSTETNREWSIAFEVIPSSLTTDQSNINIVAYLLKQTHRPIFRETQAEQFDSPILQTWSRSPNFKEFHFCPNSKLKFNSNSHFSSEHLVNSLQKVQTEIEKKLVVSTENGCVKVESKVALPNLLKVLTDYRYAPTLKCNPLWECGLGAFEVTTLDQNKIVFKRKQPSTNAKLFSSIVLAQPSAFKEKKIITDINRTIEEIPDWINLSLYSKYDVNLLQTIVVLLNIPDRKIRHAIFNCIEAEELIRAFNPTLKRDQLNHIYSILPYEIYPLSETPKDPCKPLKSAAGPFYFVNWRTNNAQLLPLLATIQKRTNIKLKIFEITPSEFVDELLARGKKFQDFDLIPMAMGAEINDFSSFFRPILAENKKYLSYKVEQGAETYQRLVTSTDKSTSLSLARQLAELIRNQYVAIPLYQVKRTFYYPSYIRNLNTGRNFLEYPEIESLEID